MAAGYQIDVTDQSQTVQNPNSSQKFGSLWGGGQHFQFGGINDSPVSKKVWQAVAVAVAVVAVVFLWRRKP